ncbi:N-acetyltransferase [Allokutzneria sp. NRRL B-24872]|uniref:GNAT family N-acetyltransferase n=1 Tax=Allokutzneria sp. NRRL B-24872 TaxID=1137961 RepID=UPI000A38FBA3|nr:GNAT family N-acetyltransferase [Allokutzneria sp. NRRL B-24872]
MTIVLDTPDVDGLSVAVNALRGWQRDRAMQLHPGDIGWFWRFGAETTAGAVRTWSRDGRVLAVGLLDGSTLLRITIAADVQQDEELVRRLVEDVTEPERGVLPAGKVNIEAPMGVLLHSLLAEQGWQTDEPWTPLSRDLAEPVKAPDLRIEIAGQEQAELWAEVLRASFEGSTFAAEKWHAMSAGTPYADARSLIGYDEQDAAVGVVTVWSAGPGLPGLIEPMGVHNDHRGRGHGRAITVAAAAALQEMGSSSALVATPTSNVGAVATYASAGFGKLAEVHDYYREN